MPPPYQANAANEADTEHPSHGFDAVDSQHAPGYAPLSPQDSWADRDTPGQGDGSECYSPPGSPVYGPTSPSFSFRGSESDSSSEASGAFSPQYDVTSPSYSPRGSQDGASGEAVAFDELTICAAAAQQASLHAEASLHHNPHGHATTESAPAGQGSSDVPAQPSKLSAFAAASPHQADVARPSTARGRDTTQQHAERSAFCFVRPTRTETAPEALIHATSTENRALGRAQVSSSSQAPAQEANQCLAAGSGTAPESTDVCAMATAAHTAAVPADAVLSDLATKLKQAEAIQAEAVQAEAAHAVLTEAVQTDGALSEAVQPGAVPAETLQTGATGSRCADRQVAGTGCAGRGTVHAHIWCSISCHPTSSCMRHRCKVHLCLGPLTSLCKQQLW